MRNFLTNLAYKMQYFMQGRNGDDALNHFLSILGIVLIFLSFFGRLWAPLSLLTLVAMVVLLWSIFRMFSRNIYKRQRENDRFLNLFKPLRKKTNIYRNMWRERATYSYYKCPQCKSYVRLRKPPKGKKIAVRCSKCNNEFVKRT